MGVVFLHGFDEPGLALDELIEVAREGHLKPKLSVEPCDHIAETHRRHIHYPGECHSDTKAERSFHDSQI